GIERAVPQYVLHIERTTEQDRAHAEAVKQAQRVRGGKLVVSKDGKWHERTPDPVLDEEEESTEREGEHQEADCLNGEPAHSRGVHDRPNGTRWCPDPQGAPLPAT